jgi:hypothetical protein
VAVAERGRVAFRSALDAHERAALLHTRAAVFYERLGRSTAAGRERIKADTERANAEAAIRQHPDWL